MSDPKWLDGLWPEEAYRCGVEEEREKWVAAFRAYQQALSQPYFDQDDESRASNRAEVQRTFDALVKLAEEAQ